MRINRLIILIFISFFLYNLNAQERMEIDKDGHVVILGAIDDSLSFENSKTIYPSECTSCGLYPTPQDYLMKLDTSGNVLWYNLYGLESFIVNDLTSDQLGNIYVAGYISYYLPLNSKINLNVKDGNFVILKYNPSGNLLWHKQFDFKTEIYSFHLEKDNNSNIYFSGLFKDNLTFGGNDSLTADGTNSFIAKFDSTGNNVWLNQIYGSSEWLLGFDTDSTGNCLVTGHFSDKEPIYFGIDTIKSNNGFNAFIAKCSGSGNPLWIKKAEGQGTISLGTDVAVNSNNNIMIGGFDKGLQFQNIQPLISNSNQFSLFVANYDSLGNEKWAIKGDTLTPWYQHIMIDMDNQGNSALVGSFSDRNVVKVRTPVINDIPINGSGSFLFVIDSIGNNTCNAHITNSDISDVQTDGSGNIFVSGVFYDQTIIQDKTFSGLDKNVFIAKFDKHCRLIRFIYYNNPHTGGSFGIDDLDKESNIRLYPNPCNDFITIQSKEKFKNGIIKIYTMTGNQVYSAQLQNQSTEINTKFLNRGIYIVKIISNSEIKLVLRLAKNNAP